MRTYTAQDERATLSLTLGASFELRLTENPTTGYRWHMTKWDSAILEVAHDEFCPPKALTLGASGEHRWEFVARGLGNSPLQLAYYRGWESGTSVKTFSLDVSVT